MRQVGSGFDEDAPPHIADVHYPRLPQSSNSLKSRSGRLRRPSGSRSWRRSALMAICAAVMSVGLFGILTVGGTGKYVASSNGLAGIGDFVGGFIPSADRIAEVAGLGIDQVAITGHRYTTDAAIFAALDLDQARSIATFDSVAARDRLEALPWVKHAALTRLYPGQLNVRISERSSYALWRRSGVLYLIDQSGHVLTATDERAAPKLPLVEGEGAGEHAAELLSLLGEYRDIAHRLERSERIGGRRWRLFLHGQVIIDLPVEQVPRALRLVTAAPSLRKVLDDGNSIVDLRASGRVAVRPINGIAAPVDGPKSIEELVRGAG